MTSTKTLAITASATILASEIDITYYTTCSLNLSGLGHVAITASGTPRDGSVIGFICNFNTTNYLEATDDITFYGFTVPAELAAKTFYVVASYNAGAWRVFFLPSLQNTALIDAGLLGASSVITAKIQDLAVTTAKINDLAVTTGKIAEEAVTNAKLAPMATMTIKGNDSGGSAVPQDLTATELRTLLDQDVTLTGEVTGTATQNAATGVTTVSTTVGAGVIGSNEKTATANTENIYIPVSFEANEVGTIYIKFAYACSLVEYFGSVSKTLAATDDGTITLYDDSGTIMTGSTMTFSASAAVGTNVNVTSATITSNQAFTTGQTMRIVTAKTTAGGRVLLTLRILRT